MSFGVCWFLLVSILVLNCPEIPGGGDCEHMGEVYVCFINIVYCFGVLRPCMVQQMLYIGNASTDKTPRT